MRSYLIHGFRFLGIVLAVGISFGASPETRKIRLTLERWEANSWRTLQPGLVLDRGDRVRFLIQTNFPGYLYVINYASSGVYSTLYPGKLTGSQNKIQPEAPIQIPSGNQDFRITGPEGQETVYWIFSPVDIPGYGAASMERPSSHPVTLVPRCDDAILKARGECVDAMAGARDLDPDDQVPGPLHPDDKRSPLTFLREGDNSVVAASGAPGAPIVYEFRLAHH